MMVVMDVEGRCHSTIYLRSIQKAAHDKVGGKVD